MESLFWINKLNYQIYEFPIIFTDRKYVKSKILKNEIFRTLKNLFILKFFY